MKKLNAGLVGLHFGSTLIEPMFRGTAEPYLNLRAVCDLDQALARQVADDHGLDMTVDYDGMLSREDLDVILLFTGPHGRAELIRKAIRAGKHVMTTKPFESSSEEAAKVLAEAHALGKVVWLNSPAPMFNRDFRIMRDWREQHQLGRLLGGHHECWYKSVEKADGSWYDDPTRCPAPATMRLGIYGINDIVQWFGEPAEVMVQQSRLFTGRPTPDFSRMSVKFADGALVDFLDGWVCQPKRGANSLVLYFENGTIMRNPSVWPMNHPEDGCIPLCLFLADAPEGKVSEVEWVGPDQLSSFYAWEAFHRAVTTGEVPVDQTPDEAIVNGVKILEATRLAVENGGVWKL